METPMLHTAEQLPPATVSLPIIDMSDGCDELRRAILDAGRELGFFQVVNHGVPEQLMLDMEVLAVEFFEMPEADKATYYSDDISKANRLCSGATYETGGERYWHDYLHLAYNFPVDDHVKDWPDMPQRLRRIMEEYVVKTRRVGMEILRLVCEGIGLRPDYFEGAISGGDMVLQMNHYPRRRDLTVAVGQPPHCDRSLITVLLPGPIPGLEVTYNGGWIKVKRIPGAFVINFGSQLEVVTNGMLKSIEHRVMTTSSEHRGHRRPRSSCRLETASSARRRSSSTATTRRATAASRSPSSSAPSPSPSSFLTMLASLGRRSTSQPMICRRLRRRYDLV